MSAASMRAVLARDWPAARRLLGADFPEEWRADSWPWLVNCVPQAEADPGWVAWGPRLLLLPETDRAIVVGEAGFHGRPDADGVAEFGYTVVARHRRQGFAEEAVRGVLRWAAATPDVQVFRATVDPANGASIGLLRKVGLAQVGRCRHPERGEELVFELDASALR
jgi:RimJ/RimL family protein N-acetyltransferase